MQVSKWILSMAMALSAVAVPLPAWAVKLQNITVNGLPYVEGMAAPASDVLTLSGNIVTETIDDFNYWYLGGNYKEAYAGVGFFAAGNDTCAVYPSSGLLTGPANPDGQLYWPDPARCIPMFSIAAKVNTSTNPTGYPLNLKFNQSSGAFSNIKVPVAALSANDFTISYQLNHWSWPSPSTNILASWPDNSSLASVRWNTTAVQYFKPQASLKFTKSANVCQRKISATGSESNTSLTILASVIPACGEATGNNKIWLMASIPNAGWFIKKPDASWATLSDVSTASLDSTPSLTGVLSAQTFPVIDHQDVSSLLGTDVYIGFGADANDMLSKGKYALVYSIR